MAATHSRTTLNASATEFYPTNNWTVMNHPRFNTLCRFHTHVSGNHCQFGEACWFVHARELHRPTFAEQTASVLQAVHYTLLFAVTCLQNFAAQPKTDELVTQQTTAEHTGAASDADDLKLASERKDDALHEAYADADDASGRMNIMVENDQSTDQEDDADADTDPDATTTEPANELDDVNDDSSSGHLAFEDALDADAELKLDDPLPHPLEFENDEHHTLAGPEDAEAKHDDAPSLFEANSESNNHNRIDEDLDWFEHPRGDADLFKFLWANSKDHLLQVLPPQVLPATYPKQLLGCSQHEKLPLENATLHKLNTAKYNDLPVCIFKFFESNKRYQVEPLMPDGSMRGKFTVKPVNLKLLVPTDLQNAYTDFMQHLRNSHDTADTDHKLLGQFPDFQLVPAPNTKEQLEFCYDWSDLTYFLLLGIEKEQLSISEKGCQLIIARLYQMSYEKPFHYLWKRYVIPLNWIWTQCNHYRPFLKFVLNPPSDAE